MLDALPWALLVFIASMIGSAPWRRSDPKHEFIVYMLNNIASRNSTGAAEGMKNCGHRPSAGWHHRPGGADV